MEEMIEEIKDIFWERYMDLENLPGFNELDIKARKIYKTVAQSVMQDVFNSISKVLNKDTATIAFTLGQLYGKYINLENT